MTDQAQLPPLRDARLHLIGVCGRGMMPLAILSRHLGARVTGCDRSPLPDRLADLQAAGVRVWDAHDVAHLRRADVVVATSIADLREPEAARAVSQGRLRHRTDLLAAVLRERAGVGITGSHGKGTVTALTAAAMVRAGLDPLVGVGVRVPALGGTTREGAGPAVLEVDDSDLSLARVRSEVAVVTNLDDDHPNLNHSFVEAVSAVGEYVGHADRLVILGRTPRARVLRGYARCEVWQLGHDVRAHLRDVGPESATVRLRAPGTGDVDAVVRLVGPATAENAALAFATAIAFGADPAAAAQGLGDVDRLDRRLEPVGRCNGVTVYDDFGGKHPVAVREGIRALRLRHPEARLCAVFEPYGPYLRPWTHRYARALGGADVALVLPPFIHPDYPGDEQSAPDWVRDRPWLVPVSDHAAATKAARAATSPGDVIVVFAQYNRSRTLARSLAGWAGEESGDQ